MNIAKRKSDECHYCANETHDRKRSKLMTSNQNEIVIPLQSNFKCRGRGGKEIEFSPGDGILLHNLKNSKSAAGRKSEISEQNYNQGQSMNFNLQPDSSVRLKSSSPKSENSRWLKPSRPSRTDVSSWSDLMDEARLSSNQSKPNSRSSAGEMSIISEKSFRAMSVVDGPQYDIRSRKSLLAPSYSDGRSSTDEYLSTCITRSRSVRKAIKAHKQDSTSSKLTSASQMRKKRYTRTSVKESLSLRTSDESVHDYLMNVSSELHRERLLGKLDQRDSHPGRSNDGTQKRTDEGGNRLKGSSRSEKFSSIQLSDHPKHTRSFQRETTVKSGLIGQLSMGRGRTGLRTHKWFWSRLFQLFSLGCWKTDINATSPSVDRKSEVSTISECDGSTSSESSSTSTGTTTVAAVAACGRQSARTKSDDVMTEEITTANIPSSRASGSGNRKLMTAKLVESLKRHRESDSDGETYEETSDKSSSGESDSESSSSAPLKPKQPASSKQQRPSLEATTKSHKVNSSPESESLNKPLLGDPAELSTENETSDAEFVDICPLHRQPI